MTETCSVKINDKDFCFDVEGDFSWGDDEILYDSDSVIANADWCDKGYGIGSVLNAEEQRQLVEGTSSIVKSIFDNLGIDYPDDFLLENYHHIVSDADTHQKVVDKSRFLKNSDFPINIDEMAARISNLIGCEVGKDNPILQEIDKVDEIVILRISRPQKLDINPPHRDGYLDIWKHTLNCWVPVSGCNDLSSLPVIDGSHLWNEQDVCRTDIKSAKINGRPYHVPAILKSKKGLNMRRPNPELGQVLMFTPFIVHGCAANLNEDITRFSFELRLFDTSKF